VIHQAQVTSVFVDVKPTDWAFLALQSLVERYFADQSPHVTRFEFAAGLNACVEPLVTVVYTNFNTAAVVFIGSVRSSYAW
jgi:hypothetical protein